jgi:hypothetical protein
MSPCFLYFRSYTLIKEKERDDKMKNQCVICKKEVNYPEGVYLKSGKEVHIVCFQKQKKESK